MSTVLAIDGGGTGTRAVICDQDGQELARGSAGSSNVMIESVKTAVSQAIEKLNEPQGSETIDYTIFSSVWGGFAGVGSNTTEIYGDTLNALKKLFQIDNVLLTSDANLLAGQLALRPDAEYGLGVIAGTGSIAMMFKDVNMVTRAGGWGSMLGDEGSGYWIGLQAIRQVVSVNDRILRYKSLGTSDSNHVQFAPWQLEILDNLNLKPGPNLHINIIGKVTDKKHLVASYTRTIFKAAFTEGEPLALKIVNEAAKHISDLISELVLPPLDPGKSVLILGGSLNGIPEYQKLVISHLNVTFKHIDVVDDPALIASKALAKKL